MADVGRTRSSLELESPSEFFHEASKLRESDTALARTVWTVNNSRTVREVIAKPSTSYIGIPRVFLPLQRSRLGEHVGEVMLKRRTVREFSGKVLSLADLSAILYFGAGVTEEIVDDYGIVWGSRCAPSGGALYPIDLYCIALRVDEVEDGLYAYDPTANALQLLTPGKLAGPLGAATFLAKTIDMAGACFLMVANFPRTKFKYGERGYRFSLLEAGHIAQNMLLVAQCIGLGALPLGGFVDDKLNELIGADGTDTAVVYAVVAGGLLDETRSVAT